MGEHLVHGVDQLRMVDEGLPVIRGRHRNRTVPLHAPDNVGQLGRGMLVPQERFITDNQAGDVAITPGEIERGRNLALVSRLVLVEPDAERDLEPELAAISGTRSSPCVEA